MTDMIFDNKSRKYEKSDEKPSKARMIALGCVGLVVGAIAGLFGAGGGVLAVPALKWAGLEERQAHATSIAIIVPLCAMIAFVYIKNGNFDFSVFPYPICGITLGAILGGFLLKKMNNIVLHFVFNCLLIAVGLKFIIGR